MEGSGQRFGPIELRRDSRQVLIGGHPVVLGRRAFDTLVALIERRDRVVTKAELINTVWAGRPVDENNLAVQVGTLRKVLGDPVIATIPGRGYRFIPPTPVPPSGSGAMAPRPAVAGSPLIGRVSETAELLALVPSHRLVTVVGPGGVGKSRLVAHLLSGWRADYGDGAAWVDLAALSEPHGVCAAIARSLGVQTGAGDPLAGLVRAAGPLSLLVVLDNAEHLIDEVARIARALLDGAARLHLVVTSQAPLRLLGEQLLRLQPLDLPPRPMPAAEALTYGAVELFVQRARAADHRFELGADNVDAVVEICRRLDGLPLAIELAAARVWSLGAAGLAAAIHDRFRLLGTTYRQVPDRQRTLRATLEWSWSLLRPAEQTVLRRLGVFAGTFSPDLVTDVVGEQAPGLDKWGVVDALGVLVDRSLVAMADGHDQRYRLPESVRALALEQLADAGETEVIRRRHAQAVLALFEQGYEDRFTGRRRTDDVFDALAPDSENGLEALRWAAQHDPATTVALMRPLFSALRTAPYAYESELWTTTAAWVDDVELTPARKARWLVGAGLFWTRTRPASAAEYATRAIDLMREHGGGWELHLALYGLSSAQLRMDGTRQPQALRELLALERPDWPPAVRHLVAWKLGNFHHTGHEPAAALLAYRQAAAFAQAAGDSAAMERVRVALMDVSLLLGNLDDAIEEGLELVRHVESTRERYLLAYVLQNLMAAWLAKGDLTQARNTAIRVLPLALKEFDHRKEFSNYLALLAASQGRLVEAARFIGFGDAAYRVTGAIRQGNEAEADARARRLVQAGMDDGEFADATAAGEGLSVDDVYRLAEQCLAADRRSAEEAAARGGDPVDAGPPP